ncbi:MAG: hypothetical protein M0Z94_08590 [Dehalococcoidales bacterium]|nr:hypothetical protein [Dehalococcoidales bacterium]
MATRGGKTRRGRRNRWDGTNDREATDWNIYRHSQNPGGLLAGDRGKIALVTSTLSHLSYRHPRAYGKHDLVPAPPAACSF